MDAPTSASTLFSNFLASTLVMNKKSGSAFETSDFIAKAAAALPSFQQEIRTSLAKELLNSVATPAQAQLGLEWLLATWPSDVALKIQGPDAGSMQGQALLDALIAKGADLTAFMKDTRVLSFALNQEATIVEHLLGMGYDIPPSAFISILDPQPLILPLIKHRNFDALRELARALPERAPAMWETLWLELAKQERQPLLEVETMLHAISDFPDPSAAWWAKVLSWDFDCRNRVLPSALMTLRRSTHAPAMQAAITQPDLLVNKHGIPREVLEQFSRSTVINENGWGGSALDAALIGLCKRGGLAYCQDFEKAQNAIVFMRDLNPDIPCVLPPSALEFIIKWNADRNTGKPLVQHDSTLLEDLAVLPKVKGLPDPDLAFFCAAAHGDGTDKSRIHAVHVALDFVPLDASASQITIAAALIGSAARGSGLPEYRGQERDEDNEAFLGLVHMGSHSYLKDEKSSVSFANMDTVRFNASIEKSFFEGALQGFDHAEISKLAPFLLNPDSHLSGELRSRVSACVMRFTTPGADRSRKYPRL